MSSRAKIKKIFNRASEGATGFWTGNPHQDTLKGYLNKLGFSHSEQLFTYLNDDCRWIRADHGYKHPQGKPIFDILGGRERVSLGQPGYFAACESLDEVDAYPWPDPDYLDFRDILAQIDSFSDKSVLTGFWSHFFHLLADLFGMENYFIKMHTDPLIVEAVTTKVVDFFVEANSRFFEALGERADIFFFGNDFGTQLDLLISPKDFQRFVLPGFKRLIEVAKKYDKKVLLHSCGSIYPVIPCLIEAGIDALHPLQAKAANMDATTLAGEFKRDIAFVGGVDTQELLVQGSPQDIREEVLRLRDILGPNLVISPSHEAILPNVPLENITAMAAAVEE